MLEKSSSTRSWLVFWVFIYIFLAILLLKSGFSNLDPDFGWHLKAGQEIYLTHEVPNINNYNYTYTGNWVDHEWLSNLAIYRIYEGYGYEYLVILFAILILTVLILLNIYTYKSLAEKPQFWIIAALQIFATLAALPHFGVRIQEVALLFVLALLIILHYYNYYQKWQILLILPLIFVVWASLHASFLLGLVLIFCWLGIKVAEKIISSYFNKPGSFLRFINTSRVISWLKLSIFGIFSALSLAATFFTPYGPGLYGFLSGYKNNAYLSLIQEWLPQYSIPMQYSQVVYLALGFIALFFYFSGRLKNKKGIEIWPVFLSLTFIILSFKSRRHFPLFVVTSFGLMVEAYSQFFGGIKIGAHKLIRAIFLFSLVLVIVSQGLYLKFEKKPFKDFCLDYPCGAVNFLQSNPEYLQKNIFNDYGWGGFLIWTMPEKKLFIDGRLPQVEFAGQTFIEEYYEFFKKEADYKEKLAEYDIRLVLIKAKTNPLILKKWEKIFFNIKDEDLETHNYLLDYLKTDNGWENIYIDEVSAIYLLK